VDIPFLPLDNTDCILAFVMCIVSNDAQIRNWKECRKTEELAYCEVSTIVQEFVCSQTAKAAFKIAGLQLDI
jgi:hypothetical protein